MIKSASRSSLVEDVKYNSMSAGVVPSSEYLIESRVLDTAVTQVTFNNLDQFAGIYKHLQVVISARSDRADAGTDNLRVFINSNTTNTSYASHVLVGTGSTVNSGADIGDTLFTNIIGATTAALGPANAFYANIIDILDAFSTTKNKTLRSLSGNEAPDAGGRARAIELRSLLFMSTNAISSLQFDQRFGSNFVAGSRFSIYGVTA